MANSFQKHDISSREMTHRVRARSAVSENKTFLKPGFFFCFVVFFRAEKNKRQRRQMFKDAEATEAMK